MGASRRPKPNGAKSVRPVKRSPTNKSRRKGKHPSPAELPEIPEGIRIEIENQRGVLGTVTTLVQCLHVVLEHQEDSDGEELSAAEAAVQWVNLPDMTAIVLERIHAVHLALDSVSLSRALKAFKQ
jgi:hypothetical protein